MIKKLKKVRKLISKVFQLKLHTKYWYAWYYKHGKLVENQVLFESFHGKTISDSPYYMLKELVKLDQYKIYYSTSDYEKHKKFLKDNGLEKIRLVKINSLKYQWAMAVSKYLINNSSFPSYFIRKENQEYLQTWHGTPLKTLGKNMKRGIESMFNVQHNFLQASHLMFPNEFTKDAIMTDYNLEELFAGKVIMSGYPRNSIFLDKQRGLEVRKELGLEEKTVYAYMPTWRGKSNQDIATNSYESEISSILEALDKKLNDDQIMYVNLHPIISQSVSISSYKHIFPFPAQVDNYEFLNCVDALITDYSSVFFDFAITEKPIMLFMYDYEEYMADRGTYFDARTLPFYKTYTTQDFVEALATERILTEGAATEDFKESYLKYDTIDSAKVLLDAFLFNKTENITIFDYEKNLLPERKVIYPSRVESKSDLDEIVNQIENQHSIVVFEKKWFTNQLNQWLFEEYNDKFTYIVIYKNLVNSYFELIGRKLGNKSVKEEIRKRGLLRCLGSLKVDSKFKKQL